MLLLLLLLLSKANAKTKAKTFMKGPQGSSRPRPRLEDIKTASVSSETSLMTSETVSLTTVMGDE